MLNDVIVMRALHGCVSICTIILQYQA